MFSTALAPQISNVEEPLPVVTFTIAAFVCTICSFFVKTSTNDLKEAKLTNQASYKRLSTLGGSSLGHSNKSR